MEMLMGRATILSEAWLKAFDLISIDAPVVETTHYWELPCEHYDHEGMAMLVLSQLLKEPPEFHFVHAVNRGGPDGSFSEYCGVMASRPDNAARRGTYLCWGKPDLTRKEALDNFAGCWAAAGAMLSHIQNSSWDVMLDPSEHSHRMTMTRNGQWKTVKTEEAK